MYDLLRDLSNHENNHLTLEELETRLTDQLLTKPTDSPRLLSQLEQYQNTRKLPSRSYDAIKKLLASANGASFSEVEKTILPGTLPESAVALDDLLGDERTRVPMAPTSVSSTPRYDPPPVAAVDQKTMLKVTAPLVDKTVLQPPSPPDDKTRLFTEAQADSTVLYPGRGAPAASPPQIQAPPPVREASQFNWQDLANNPQAQPPDVGDMIKDRFVLTERIGVGGMGVVFKARDLRKEEAHDRDSTVAIKLLSEEFKRHPDSLKTLQREAAKAQTLAHPNIVTVYDFDRDGATIYMTMQYLQGTELVEMRRRHRLGMEFEQALPIIEGIASALAYAHQKNIVHSDLKPGNVFITTDGTVKVVDFGIARAIKSAEQPDNGDDFDAGSLGALTPAYASAEMLRGESPDARDDIYALGCIAYELLTGSHPYQRHTALEAIDGRLKPAPVEKLRRDRWDALAGALQLERDARTATVSEFIERFRGLPKKKLWPKIAAGITIAALGSAAYFYYTEQKQLTEAAMMPMPVESAKVELSAADAEKIQRLRDAAEIHGLVGRLTEPPGSNAFEAYQQILQIDPSDVPAAQGLASIANHYEQEASQKLAAGDLPAALTAAETGLKAVPTHPQLRNLYRELKDKIK